MRLLVNDLSLHGQFTDLGAFRDSIRRVMRIRTITRHHMRQLYCHRNLVNAQVTQHIKIPAAVRALPLNERRAVMAWLSQQGPFWYDDRLHGEGDWYECAGDIVTDTAVGEAAHCLFHGIDSGLISLHPSNFQYNPVQVDRVLQETTRDHVKISNYWEPAEVESYLSAAPLALNSWLLLRELSTSRFDQLRFSDNAFDALNGQPFKQSVAERILVRLNVLHQLKQAFHEDGTRTSEGHEIYQQYFTGAKAWFSDSSESEKNEYR